MKDISLFGLKERVFGTVRNIDRAADSANISSFGPSGVEVLDFDVDIHEANVVTSIAGEWQPGRAAIGEATEGDRKRFHFPVLDLDVPAHLVPSSTSGHSHLYIDKLLSWDQYKELLTALAKAGIIEDGYAGASIARGHTAVRLPWKRKKAVAF